MPVLFQHAYSEHNDEYNFMFLELQRGIHKPAKILKHRIPFDIEKDLAIVRVNKQFFRLLAKHLFNVEGNIKEVTLREIKREAYITSLGKTFALLNVTVIRLYGLEEEVALHFASYITQRKSPKLKQVVYFDQRTALSVPEWKFDKVVFLLKTKFSYYAKDFVTTYLDKTLRTGMSYYFNFRKE